MTEGSQGSFVLPDRIAFAAVAYALLIGLASTTIPTPLYVLYQKIWHFSPAMLTVIFSTYMVAVFGALVFLGRVSDQIGRRPVLIAGVVLAIIATVMAGLGPSMGWLIAARVFVGIAAGLLNGTVTATLTELQRGGDPKRASLVASACTTGGLGAGPLMSGLVADWLPMPLFTPYLVTLILLLPALYGTWKMPETVTVRPGPVSLRPKIGAPRAMLVPFILCGMTCFAGFALLAEGAALTPSYLHEVLHLEAVGLGGFLVSVNFGASAIVQLFLRRIAPLRAILAGLCLIVVGVGMIVASAPLDSVAMLIAAAVVSGVGQGGAFMGSLAIVNRLAPPQRRGELTAGYFALGYLGGTAPVVLTGYAAGAFGLYHATIAFALGLSALALILMAGFILWSRSDARANGAKA